LDIIEKPKNGMEFGNIAKMGCYVLSPQLISKGKDFFRDADGNIATTAAFSNLCRNNEIAFCVKYNGEYLDIGTTDAYISHLKNFKSLIEW
jgi:UTP-glucose-1-phosphate uridylyltransferase